MEKKTEFNKGDLVKIFLPNDPQEEHEFGPWITEDMVSLADAGMLVEVEEDCEEAGVMINDPRTPNTRWMWDRKFLCIAKDPPVPICEIKDFINIFN